MLLTDGSSGLTCLILSLIFRPLERTIPDVSKTQIFLNGLLLGTHLVQGMWSLSLLRIQLLTVPFLLLGMWIGSLLNRRMKQRTFMILTYVLLLISGISLFFK